MKTSIPFCELFSQINWIWYTVSVIVVYALGAMWYSRMFAKEWMKVFNVEMPNKFNNSNMIITILSQFVATALFGLAMFMITFISPWLALLTLIAFCGWQKASLKFRLIKWKEYFTAAMIEAGYLFISGMIFIFLALVN